LFFKRLLIFVEGCDDIRFFENIIKPTIVGYDSILIRPYSQLRKKDRNGLIKGAKANKFDYLYVSDYNDSTCVTEKKVKHLSYLTAGEKDKIRIVRKEIESWYLAGLSSEGSQNLGIWPPANTEYIDKNQFDKLIPDTFESKTDFMVEILKHFSVEVGITKNRSMEYFMNKFKVAK
jgi:hypothetical protein